MRILITSLVIVSIFTAWVVAVSATQLDGGCIARSEQCKILAENECCGGLICVPSILFFRDIGVSANITLYFVAVTHQDLSRCQVLLLTTEYSISMRI